MCDGSYSNLSDPSASKTSKNNGTTEEGEEGKDDYGEDDYDEEEGEDEEEKDGNGSGLMPKSSELSGSNSINGECVERALEAF